MDRDRVAGSCNSPPAQGCSLLTEELRGAASYADADPTAHLAVGPAKNRRVIPSRKGTRGDPCKGFREQILDREEKGLKSSLSAYGTKRKSYFGKT